MSATVQQICRYPVKGLNADVLPRAVLTPGRGLPDDRRFAIAYGRGTGARRGYFDLVREERLDQLRVAYDASRPDGPTVTLSRQGRQVVSANPTSQTGRMLLGQFFAGFLTGSGRGAPSFQEAADARRDPLLPNAASLLNWATHPHFDREDR